MKVARQLTSWNAFTKKTRSVLSAIARMATEEGHGLSWSIDRFAIQGRATFLPTQSYRSLRDGFDFSHPLAVNCQATITWSLRDKRLARDLSTFLTLHHPTQPDRGRARAR